jgi:hypothetical protein
MTGILRRARAAGAVTCLAGLQLLLCSCRPDDAATHRPSRHPERVTIAQGVWGDVWYWSGNFMPVRPSGSVRAVPREVLVHALTVRDSVTISSRGSTFYSSVRTSLVGSTWSDGSGFFQLALEPGSYSVFVREDSLYYANDLDGRGNISAVIVPPGGVAEKHLDINYLARY